MTVHGLGRASGVDGHCGGGGGCSCGEELRGEWLDGWFDTLNATGGGEGTLCGVTVAFALAVLLVGVLDGDFLVHEVLAVHVGDGVVGGFKGGKGDEAVTLAQVVFISGDLEGVS